MSIEDITASTACFMLVHILVCMINPVYFYEFTIREFLEVSFKKSWGLSLQSDSESNPRGVTSTEL